MENTTRANGTIYRFRKNIWLNDVVFCSISAIVSVYLLVVLLYRQRNEQKQKREKFSEMSLPKKYGLMSKYLCILLAGFSLIRQLNSIGLLMLDAKAFSFNQSNQQINAKESVCVILSSVGSVSIATGSGIVHIFLWLRQRIFYADPILKTLNSKWLQLFSSALVFVLVLFWPTMGIAYFAKVSFQYGIADFCVYVINSGDEWAYAHYVAAWFVTSGVLQVSLLGLFIYPMLKTNKPFLGLENQVEGRRKNGLMKKVKKAVILASVCLGTDIFSGIVLAAMFQEHSNSPLFMININLIINHVAVIACFDQWKNIVMPWSKKSRTNTKSTTLSASTKSQPEPSVQTR